MAMLLKIHPDNPSERQIKKVAECLRNGGVIVYPTDTVYAFGCDIHNTNAVEKVARIKNVDPRKTHFSFICYDLSDLSNYSKPLNKTIFKIMKRALPGPFTFVLDASNKVPRLLLDKKKTIGIRVPDNNIPRDIVKELGNPIISSSVKENSVQEYFTDPELICEQFKGSVDIVIDGGPCDTHPSTVIDATDDGIAIIRQGKGIIEEI